MPLTIRGRTINRVLLIDDDEAAQRGLAGTIEDLGLAPVLEKGPLSDVRSFVESVSKKADAVFCDYKLGLGGYSSANGDVVTAECYQRQIPSILCTTYPDIDLLMNRKLVRYIPVLLRTSAPSPEEIEDGYRRCVEEFVSGLPPSRKPWRALVRVHEVDSNRGYFYVVLPGWDVREKVRLDLDQVPDHIRGLVKPDQHFHARVNIGANMVRELYFDDWEAA